MNLQQLEYVLKVAECGSISKAAQQLYLSQPSLTKSIMNLESEFGIQIFLRTNKGIQLTEKGREFLNSAKDVLRSVDTLNKTFHDNKNSKDILSVVSQQFNFIYDIMLELYNQYEPQMLHMDLFETDRGSIIDAVLKNVANIGIIVLTDADSKAFQMNVNSKELEMHVLDSSGLFLTMGPNSAFYSRDSVAYNETGKVPTILLDAEESIKLKSSLGQEFADSPMSPSFYCNTISACYTFLHKANIHLCTPKWVIGMFQDTTIRSIPITPSKGYPYPINKLIWFKRAFEPLNNIERNFIDLLEQRFAPCSAKDEGK